MDGLELFTTALDLGEPWRVTGAEFAPEPGRLDLDVACQRGARFPCPEPGCGHQECPVHDTVDKTWRHLDSFEHKAFLHARVPWVRPGSGFTMLFEALVLTFAKAMPMARVAASAPALRRSSLDEHRAAWCRCPR